MSRLLRRCKRKLTIRIPKIRKRRQSKRLPRKPKTLLMRHPRKRRRPSMPPVRLPRRLLRRSRLEPKRPRMPRRLMMLLSLLRKPSLRSRPVPRRLRLELRLPRLLPRPSPRSEKLNESEKDS